MPRPFALGVHTAPHGDATRLAVAALEATVPVGTLALADGRYLHGLDDGTWLVAARAHPAEAPAAQCSWESVRQLEDHDRGNRNVRARVAAVLRAAEAEAAP